MGQGEYVHRISGNVAGLAGHGHAVFVEFFQNGKGAVMGIGIMAIGAGGSSLTHRRGGAAAGDFVVRGGMAFLAGEIKLAHVNIKLRVWFEQVTAQIAVFDIVAAPGIPVAFPTVTPAGQTHLFCNVCQVKIGIGSTAAIFSF